LQWLSEPPGRWIAFLVIAAGLTVAAFALDDWAARIAEKPIRSGQIRTTLVALRFFGDGAPLILLTLLAFALAPQKKTAASLALAAALLSGLAVDRAKTLTARNRPFDMQGKPAHESWNAADNNGRNSSFPSGHSATAFGFARGMSLAFPAVAPVAYLAAGGTALSRMHELRHYFSDCTVGALVGWSIATLLWMVRKRLASAPPASAESSDDPPDVLPLARSA
jgi:membrane-associated phospholipid phosphatase